MSDEPRRHRLNWAEQAWKRRVIDTQDRVLRIDGVEGHVALIGIDDDLDRVADVAEAAGGGLGVRKALADRVRVLDPEQVAIINHQIGIVVKGQEWREPGYPSLDLAPDLN